MGHQRRIFSALMAAALVANTIAPAYAESGADSSPSLPTTPVVQPQSTEWEDWDLTDLFFVGLVNAAGGREIIIYHDPKMKIQGEYDPAGAARDRGEPPPPPPPPATPATAMATTPEGQAAQQQVAAWKADLEKKIADPKTSPQDKQIAENKLTALNQFGNLQQTDAAAAGAPGGR